ncbi:DUF6782 family putative metallopeptidase [Aliiruegeria sabulilitoris]|uniref:DUF6782 family putative metallopeptidase n=1 Tax=Aliiruegeria sabulilitoris TaxID=1510458 RepID=UPI000830BE6A|nr:DUF6782 family putative metallopeptidase [Aliiruegeria sabulilitoris]NDR59192.1 hypothetical protein [Pseudoruegeria sp. M32A2M]
METTLPAMTTVVVFVATLVSAQEPPEAKMECLPFPYNQANNVSEHRIRDLVVWIRQVLGPKSDLLSALDDLRPEICLVEAIFGAEAYFEKESNRVVLKSDLSTAMMQAVAIHELRHVHQAKAGTCPRSTLSMQETARMTLALEADASAVSLAIAWDLKEAGAHQTWNALSDWSTHADLADEFEKEMNLSGDKIRATAKAFAKWYTSDWRREEYYLSACSEYLDRQDRNHAIPMYGMAPAEFLDHLCRLPSGEPYRCEEPSMEDK